MFNKNKVIEILVDVCENRIVEKKMDVDLFESGLIDSMGFIELLSEIEAEFGFEIEPADVKRELMNTPFAVIEYVEKKLGRSLK